MNKTLYKLFIPDTGEPVLWLADQAPTAVDTPCRHCSLEQVKSLIGNGRLIILVPGHHVSLLSSQTELSSRRKIRETLPYLLEDELAAPPEALHFAWKQNQQDLLAAVIDQQLMDRLTQLIEEYDWPVDALTPDWSLLDQEQGGVIIHSDGFSACLPGGTYFSGMLESLPQWMDLACRNQQDDEPVSLTVYSLIAEPEMDVDLPTQGNGWELCFASAKRESCELPQGIDNRHHSIIELRQGDYSSNPTFDLLLRNYKPALAALIIWGFISWTGLIIENSRLEKQIEDYNQLANEIFLSTFPDTKTVILPRQQMEQRLKNYRDKTDINQGGMLAMLQSASATLEKTAKEKVQGIRYIDDQLFVDIKASNNAEGRRIADAFKPNEQLIAELKTYTNNIATLQLSHQKGNQDD